MEWWANKIDLLMGVKRADNDKVEMDMDNDQEQEKRYCTEEEYMLHKKGGEEEERMTIRVGRK